MVIALQESGMDRKNVLIIDPERDVCELFARALEARKEYRCYLTSKGEDAVALLRDIEFDLVLVESEMLIAGDCRLLKKINRMFPGTVVVVEAYLHQKDQVNRALQCGASGHVIKPIAIDEFRKKIQIFYQHANP